jgi:hypothetical protein
LSWDSLRRNAAAVSQARRSVDAMPVVRALLGICFLIPVGMFLSMLLTGGHWWPFFALVGVLLSFSHYEKAKEKERRHQQVRENIQRRVEELQRESYGDERDTFDPTWGREIVDLDKP